MLTQTKSLLCTLVVCLSTSTALAQASLTEFQNALQQKAALSANDLAALNLNQPMVRVSPVTDKEEIAVAGLVNIHARADEFLRSYRESMLRKTNPAILEIGRFGPEAALADIETLTLEPGDIEDLKDCVVGDCQVKLSALMIERFRREINWNTPDNQAAATKLFQQMLVDYVKDYRERGDAALIEYNDKQEKVSLAAEQHALSSAPGYLAGFLSNPKTSLKLIEETLVWSKIKFGLKPVITINHISIYRRNSDFGPQVLITSKQIYANHYFNGALGLTALVRVADATDSAYLVYENRSRADGLNGPFGKLKRALVEKKALEGLRAILEQSKAGLEGSTPNDSASEELSAYQSYGWGHRLFGGVRPLLWLLLISALIALVVLGSRRAEIPPASKKPFKPESAKS